MFKKVLIAEDHEVANLSVQKTIKELGVSESHYVYYCDDALARIKKGLADGAPYDLLITDLVFEEDEVSQKISGGKDLVRLVKELQPDIKVIVFSSIDRISLIDGLFRNLQIDGYVRKARNDGQHLREALESVSQNKIYQSPDIRQSLRSKNTHEFSALDIQILQSLSQGIKQKNIPEILVAKNIKPSGLSSIEKRLNLMKEVFGFTNNEQLVVYCKDKGLF
ncbi:response regulator [Sphingobacterium lactis]|uniref:DNA-binding response regulator, NarL/FixJ family, contains REC and HTH domains n=1 Tax=Sphingobacterium lactis TaxID=797291 RepID=A0A1H5XYF1_9SPHI|nr:response regulator transcription factor [Sphingobacterium lactis]SEG16467.1 DNA-binding response regulator, NarL/FixJ family, contains REC and HTH domains [Sphingobacterium lactis]